jgi:hypothetical protein
MSSLVLAILFAAQSPVAPLGSVLCNDHPQFPIGFARDRKLLEDVNLSAIKDPSHVREFMEQAAKRGELLAIPSGTRAKPLSTHKLRGPVFKEIVEVEVTDGTQQRARGWVCAKALLTDREYAAIGAAGEGRKAEEPAYTPLYRDPIPGEKAYLAPQPTMFGMVRSLIRLAVADDSASAVFAEWQGANESSRDAVLKRLELKKAIFFAPVNTEVKVQKVFPELVINAIYPVQVEFQSGQLKGRVGWVPVTVVSPVPGKNVRPALSLAESGSTEAQRTLQLRRQKRQQRSQRQAQVTAETDANAAKESEQQTRNMQLRSQLQLQMLQQQGAIAEARAAEANAAANQQLARTLRQVQLQDAYRNGGGVVYGPDGAMTIDELLRSQNP